MNRLSASPVGTHRPTPAGVATMDALDWDLFVARYWDRAPVLVTVLPTPPFEAQEVFQAAVAGTRPPAPRFLPPNVQFCIDRDQQTEPGDWLPELSDGSLTGYQQRMAEQLDGRRYALVVHAFHATCAAQWQRQRAFYASLWSRIGLPLTGAITTLFHGSYEHSPVGVHQDRFATFMYALSGRKRMRFWPARPWSEPVTTVLDYEPYLDSSFTAEVEPGQLLYWPASYYHVGESDLGDEPATSINVGVPRGARSAQYDIESFLYDRVPEPFLTEATDPARQPPEPAGLLVPPTRAETDLEGRLPSALTRAVDAFDDGREAARIRDRVTVLSLRRWTSDGFLPAPAPAQPRTLADGDIVRAVAPILWAESGQTRLCAANGHVTGTPLPAGQLADLVTRLRRGAPLPVAEVPETGRHLLEALESFRALVRG